MYRPAAEPGVWRYGHVPREPEEPDRVPTRQLAVGALASLLAGWLIWGLLWNEYLGDYWVWPFLVFVPDGWTGQRFVVAAYIYYAVWIIGLIIFFGRLGRWNEAIRRMVAWARRGGQPHGAPPRPRHQPIPPPDLDPVQWPHLRAAGAAEAADQLAQELQAGRMNDVDHARIDHAWQEVQGHPERLRTFVDAVRRDGAAACPHGSGARDLPARTAHHDLTLRQVRIGIGTDADRNPYSYKGVGVALDPGLLGTSALTVGPPALAARLVRPVVESLCLQALTGSAAVVSVTAADTGHLPDSAWDVVIRPGRPDSSHGLDLYGGAEDPDEAAAMVAEALVGDEVTVLPGGDSRRAATALAQLLGPYRAAYRRFPSVGQLRDLLDGSRTALDALRTALRDNGLDTQTRDLDAYERQAAQPAGVSSLLAERLALLDRPAFASFFVPEPPPAAPGDAPVDAPPRYKPFSLQALEHPLRVRVDLPERGHAEASRIIARLVLAQFTQCAASRRSHKRFACLVMDDAAQTITPQSLRALQRLRSAHAGVMLTLPALGDVPEPLRGPLLGAVGCRVVCSGVTPWDGAHFAEAWGSEWIETRTVTNHEIRADEPMTRAMHSLRRMVTGKAVTRESVTVRREQRQRWSASDLANELKMGHAVVSLTSVSGERTPPILTKITD